MKLLIISFLFLMFPLWSYCQNSKPIVDAWEPILNENSYENKIEKPNSIFEDVIGSMLAFYQEDISETSISRCPFAVSCSNFFKKAINKYGIFGFFLFIDRYFYRENINSFAHYTVIKEEGGVLKLNDKNYLFED